MILIVGSGLDTHGGPLFRWNGSGGVVKFIVSFKYVR